ncbi:MAG: hypothetical protein NTX03_00815 [Bacteroidetes bacterium]|nr:hypothetical protein [Bacteroidota bacterium]
MEKKRSLILNPSPKEKDFNANKLRRMVHSLAPLFWRGVGVRLILLLLLSSCAKQKEEEVPSYIHVEKGSFTPGNMLHEDSSLKIPDVWLTVNNQFIGAFEMPVTAPVLQTGKSKIYMRAGVKENGIAATRSIYPFYKPYIIDTTIDRRKTITLNPVWSYIDNPNFGMKEGFEGISWEFKTGPGNIAKIDTSKEVDPKFGGTFCMKVNMTSI